MEKPIIIICGVPHSFTSMVANFLIDNGAYAKDTWDNPKWDRKYSRFEDREIQNYVNHKKDFKNYDLAQYFKDFPDNKICVIKHPRAAFYLDDIKNYTDRKLKVICVFRNPEQIILSSMEKAPKSFIYYFERIVWMYDFVVKTRLDVYALIAERIKRDARRLLVYCNLPVDNIIFDSIKGIKKRKVSYVKYRFANFVWKLFSKIFKVT